MARSFPSNQELEFFVDVDLSDPPSSPMADLRSSDPWTFNRMQCTWRNFILRVIDKLGSCYHKETGFDFFWSDIYYLFIVKIEKGVEDVEYKRRVPELFPTDSFVEAWIESQNSNLTEDDFIDKCINELDTSSFHVLFDSFCKKIEMTKV
jgi:hypothetical protein